MTPERQRIIIMALAGIFGILMLIGLGFTIFRSQQGKVVVNAITPNDATVKLDGTDVKAGTHYVTPGKHQFVLTRAAFVEKKIDFEIKAGETKGFDLYIVPDEDAGLEWLKQNPDEGMILDGYVSNAYEEDAQRVYTNNQILHELPITETNFRIDHGVSKKGGDFAIYIQAEDDAGRVAAIETLKYLGYDPDKFEIIYTAPAQ